MSDKDIAELEPRENDMAEYARNGGEDVNTPSKTKD